MRVKDGDPSQQADDINSISEAHDSCVRAGVIQLAYTGKAMVVLGIFSLTSST